MYSVNQIGLKSHGILLRFVEASIKAMGFVEAWILFELA
jgi:hypothetical protein